MPTHLALPMLVSSQEVVRIPQFGGKLSSKLFLPELPPGFWKEKSPHLDKVMQDN